MASSPVEVQAIEITASRKFHQIFTVPATDERSTPLKVTYAVAGVEHGEDVPTILFCGGMFGTRWQALSLNVRNLFLMSLSPPSRFRFGMKPGRRGAVKPYSTDIAFKFLAEKEGVRVLFFDRAAFGGSTPVPLEERISTFLEVAPLLLAHLRIKHITLASHSAGTIYALNLLCYRPDLLSPTNPNVNLLSPWVHQDTSSVTYLQIVSMLPNAIFENWSKVMGFVVKRAQPAFTFSGGVITTMSSAFKSKSETEQQKKEESEKAVKGFGMSPELKEAVDKMVFKYVFAENTAGVNDEARLCLKATKGTEWDACEDYFDYVDELAAVWKKKSEEQGKKLKVYIALPEDDSLVGNKGMDYFESCWSQDRCGEGIEVECERLKGTDHDGTCAPTCEAVDKLFGVSKVL